MYIKRYLTQKVVGALESTPAVALIGPRQVGKTTLALELAKSADKPTIRLDMESPSDLAKLDDPQAYLSRFSNTLVVIDEIQRKPELFPLLRTIIDSRIQSGERASQFLILGSASPDLLRQSSESLAGRIRYLELSPFSVAEAIEQPRVFSDFDCLWLRGGFPKSFLADSDHESWNWRNDFIRTYAERDIPQLGIRIPSTTIRSFWSMLAWSNAQQINYSTLGSSLGVTHNTAKNYLHVLISSFVARLLPPWSKNSRKRLVKSPKLYLRDTGLTHSLLLINSMDALYGHPAIGASWEAFVVENILRELPNTWVSSYYRTRAGAEIDLVLEGPSRQVRAIEIKRSTSPKASRGFHQACDDINVTEKFVIYNGMERYPMAGNTEAIGLKEFIDLTRAG